MNSFYFSEILNKVDVPKTTTDFAITNILNIVFGLAASIAVLMIVIGGFRYILAKGDPSNMSQARNTVIYALVGLIVVMAAYSIVTFIVKAVA